MKADIEFLEFLSESHSMKINQIPYRHNRFEYLIQEIDNHGSVFNTIDIEHELINIDNKVIGFFGINTEDKQIAYYIIPVKVAN